VSNVRTIWTILRVITEVLPRNVSAGAIALINSLGALGSFIGAYIVGYLNGTTGDLVLLIFYGGLPLRFSDINHHRLKRKLSFQI